MVLATLNTSVDMPDYMLYGKLSKAKAGTTNEMESIAELFAECLADTEFDFDENANDDSNSNSLAKKITPLKYWNQLPEMRLNNVLVLQSVMCYFDEAYNLPSYMGDVISPPPQV